MFDNYTRYKSQANKLKSHLIENFTEEKQYEMFANHVYKEEAFEIEEWLTQLEAERTRMKICFIADFFADEINGGGGELSNEELINITRL